MMDSRAQFEDWASDNGASPRAIHRGNNGGYVLMSTFSAWEAWQASRAAIEVSLPGKVSKLNATDSGFVLPDAENYDEAIDDCAEAIRASGISIKGESS